MKSTPKQNKGLTVEASSSPLTNAPDPRRWKALALLSLTQFVVILDTSIIGIALPTIQQHCGSSCTFSSVHQKITTAITTTGKSQMKQQAP